MSQKYLQLVNIKDMNPGEYILDQNRECHIVAKSVDRKYLIFDCPFCLNKYKKDGTPFKNAKRVEHIHGAEGFHNYSIGKAPHCSVFPKKCDYFIIYVTDKTQRN